MEFTTGWLASVITYGQENPKYSYVGSITIFLRHPDVNFAFASANISHMYACRCILHFAMMNATTHSFLLPFRVALFHPIANFNFACCMWMEIGKNVNLLLRTPNNPWFVLTFIPIQLSFYHGNTFNLIFEGRSYLKFSNEKLDLIESWFEIH